MSAQIHPVSFRVGWLQQFKTNLTSFHSFKQSKIIWNLDKIELYFELYFQALYRRTNNHRMLIYSWWIYKHYNFKLILAYTRNKIQSIKTYKLILIKRIDHKTKKTLLKQKKISIINELLNNKFINMRPQTRLNVFKNFSFFTILIFKVSYLFNAQGLSYFMKSHLSRGLALRFLINILIRALLYKQKLALKHRLIIALTNYGFINYQIKGIHIRCAGRLTQIKSRRAKIYKLNLGKVHKNTLITLIDLHQIQAITKLGVVNVSILLAYNAYLIRNC
uniref:ribosomal protein S3 n=1 Tax=Porphyridium aerugineum TaxID=2792 RepID=UPI001FCD93CF|nr:ribosomal protein S3 [Porphyridium aerugineum]UNJ18815.1 ribosomal protein S3 [Porphyridium aerugineum]